MTPLVLKSYKGVLVLLHYKYICLRQYYAIQSTNLCDNWLSGSYGGVFQNAGGGMYLNAVIYSAYWLEEDVNIGV